MKLHPRSKIVSAARGAFDLFLLDLEEKHQLTYGEIFSMLGEAIARYAKSAIRMERHPRHPDKGGDEA